MSHFLPRLPLATTSFQYTAMANLRRSTATLPRRFTPGIVVAIILQGTRP
jgi:hypothetical protein